MIMLSPRAANFASKMLLNWESWAAGSCPRTVKISTPAGSFEQIEPQAGSHCRCLGWVCQNLLNARNDQKGLAHHRVHPGGFRTVDLVQDIDGLICQIRIQLDIRQHNAANFYPPGCNQIGPWFCLTALMKMVSLFISVWRIATGMAFATPPCWIPILTILDI